MSSAADHRTTDLFDEPGLWRAAAAASLGFRGLDLAAAVAPGAGFPAVLGALATSLAVGRDSVVVDVGAGLAGASAWLASLTGARVLAVEPAAGSRRAASEMFPELTVLDGTADDLPIDDGTADAVTAIGVCSLLVDLDPLFDEVLRVLRPGGRIGIADMFLVEGDVRDAAPNMLRSVAYLSAELARRGFVVVNVECGPPEPGGSWATPQRAIDEEIERRHGRDDMYADWKSDQAHLGRLVDDGVVMSGCVVARSGE